MYIILPFDVVYMQVVVRQLRVWQLVPVRKIMYEGQCRDLVFYASRIFEPGKRRRVGICDDSSEPSLLPYTKYGCLAERIHVVYLTCSSLRQPSIFFFFSSFIINFLFGLLKFIYIISKRFTPKGLC